MNKDLRSILHWLNANKIYLNVTKTEVVIFRGKGKVFDTDIKLKMCGKKLYPCHNVKYLGVYLDEDLLKLMPCSLKFVILLMKPLSDLSILISSVPICLMHVLLGDNPFYLIEFAFYRKMLYV